MSDATRRADRWLRVHNARGDDMDPCCSCFTCEMATALLAAEARAEKAEREIATLRADLDVADSRKSGVIRGLVGDLDAAREALRLCVAFMAGNTMSSDDVNCHCIFCDEAVTRGIGCEHEECRQGKCLSAARRCLGEEP